jgi:hypothetical protein
MILIHARVDMAAAGTQTAGIIFSGDPYSAFTETYDGTSYTEVGRFKYGKTEAQLVLELNHQLFVLVEKALQEHKQ